MKFAVAVKDTEISKNTECCDNLVIFEKKYGSIVMRQNMGKPSPDPALFLRFLKKQKVESLICDKLEENISQILFENGIKVVTGLHGKADLVADNFSADKTKKQANIKSCLQPMPRILVSCRSLEGEDNVLAVGYCGNCSYDPPMIMVGIVPSRYSYKMIKESGCFVANLVDTSYQDTFNYLGRHSKRDEDKLALMNVRLLNGEKVNAPILADCPVNIECSVVDSIVTGSHEMFIGKIEYVHADNALLDDKGNIIFSKINFL